MSPVQYPKLKLDSPNVKYTTDQLGHQQIESLYEYEHVRVHQQTPEIIQVSVPYPVDLPRARSHA